MNNRKEEAFKQKENAGRRTDGCKLALNMFKFEISSYFLHVRAVRFWNNFQSCGGKETK